MQIFYHNNALALSGKGREVVKRLDALLQENPTGSLKEMLTDKTAHFRIVSWVVRQGTTGVTK